MTVLRGAAATDVGRVREINEDRYLVTDGLFAVADGVGGHQAGEVASQAAVERLADSYADRTPEGLVEAVLEANRSVWRLAQDNVSQRGMGTTLTALALVGDGDDAQLVLANVGDSRGYLFQHGELVQITEDHSLVEELVREGQLTHEQAQVHPQRSIITRALGMEPEIAVDSWTLIPYAGDRIVLATDGLTNEVSDDRIAATLRQLADPEEAARDLVRQARANGGSDNITVVVVDVVDDEGRAERASAALAGEDSKAQGSGGAGAPWGQAGGQDGEVDPPGGTGSGSGSGSSAGTTATATRTRPPTQATSRPDRPRARRLTWRVVGFLIALIAVLGVVAASALWYARSAYFVTIDDQSVAIYRGRPGGFLSFDPKLVERRPDVNRADLTPAEVERLKEGVEEPSRGDAERYADNLRDQTAARRAVTTTTSLPATTTTTTPPPGAPPP